MLLRKSLSSPGGFFMNFILMKARLLFFFILISTWAYADPDSIAAVRHRQFGLQFNQIIAREKVNYSFPTGIAFSSFRSFPHDGNKITERGCHLSIWFFQGERYMTYLYPTPPSGSGEHGYLQPTHTILQYGYFYTWGYEKGKSAWSAGPQVNLNGAISKAPNHYYQYLGNRREYFWSASIFTPSLGLRLQARHAFDLTEVSAFVMADAIPAYWQLAGQTGGALWANQINLGIQFGPPSSYEKRNPRIKRKRTASSSEADPKEASIQRTSSSNNFPVVILYPELLGVGFIGSLNIEVPVGIIGTKKLLPACRAGISAFQEAILGLDLRIGPAEGRHFLDLSGGAAFSRQVTEPYFQAGYRFEGHNGFFIRPAISVKGIFVYNGFIWPSLSIGYALKLKH